MGRNLRRIAAALPRGDVRAGLQQLAGARNVHDDIVVNLLAELPGQLRGCSCRPFAGDGAIETIPGQTGLDREVDLPAIGVTLPLTEICSGVVFPVRPRLVRHQDSQDGPEPVRADDLP